MKQTFCLARATLLLLVMLCSIGAWAQSNPTTYDELVTAIGNVSDGGTVTIGEDIAFTGTITINKDVTIDLNGQSITRSSGDDVLFNIEGNKHLTLRATGGGNVTKTDMGNAFYVDNNGILTVEGGNISTSNGAAINNKGITYIYDGTIDGHSSALSNNGTMYIFGGTIIGDNYGNSVRNEGTLYVFTGATLQKGIDEVSGTVVNVLASVTTSDASVTSYYGSMVEAVTGASAASGSTLKLWGDVDLSNIVENFGIVINTGANFTLDLNGHTINRGLTTPTANGGVIKVEVGGNLTIKDSHGGGTITGGNNSYATGSGVHVAGDHQTSTGGTLTLEGGIITGNTGDYAVGIGDYAHFTMTGGTITGNEGSGVDAGFQTVFKMSGGSITSNSLYGIQTHSGQPTEIKFAGAPVVTGNTNGNLYLDKNRVFTISGEMTAGANIGITTESRPTPATPVTLSTSNAYVTDANAAYFKADVYGYNVYNDEGTLKMSNTFTDQPTVENGVMTLQGNVDASAVSSYKDEVTSVVCAPGTMLPGDCWNLFANFSQVQTIDLSNADMSHVTNISYMFYNCSAQTITFADNLQLATIGNKAFFDCGSLTSITIPASVTSIGNNAFDYCSNLASVYVMATTPPTLGTDAFNSNASGRKIYVPASSVGDSSSPAPGTYKHDWSDYASDIEAFPHWTSGDCTVSFAGTTLIVEKTDPNGATGAMADYTDANYQPWAANRLVIKTIVINEGVTSIGKYAFSNCEEATSVSIPASVTSIGYYSFNFCPKLSSLNIAANSSLETIGSFAFNCAGFGSVTIPASVKSIGNNAFDGSATLTTVTLNSNPFIGESAFYSSTAVTMNLTANGPVDGAYWTTFYNKNYSFEADANTQVFKAELVGTKITLHEVANRVVDAGEGVVLKTTGGGNPEMTLTTSASGDSQNNSLAGVSAPAGVTADGTMYVLNNGSNGVGFYKLTAGKTLGVGKAYLYYSGTTAPGFFGLDVDNENTTAINEHELNESHELSGAWYDLQGRKIANGQKPTAKGLYIVNGKKIMIK